MQCEVIIITVVMIMVISKEQGISVTIHMSQNDLMSDKLWVVKEGKELRKRRWLLAPG